MTNSDKKTSNLLLMVGLAEGISFLILILIAMPLKYFFGMHLPVRIIGMIHGILFIGYAIALLKATLEYNWTFKKALFGFLLSFLPFGTFYLDRILKKEM